MLPWMSPLWQGFWCDLESYSAGQWPLLWRSFFSLLVLVSHVSLLSSLGQLLSWSTARTCHFCFFHFLAHFFLRPSKFVCVLYILKKRYSTNSVYTLVLKWEFFLLFVIFISSLLFLLICYSNKYQHLLFFVEFRHSVGEIPREWQTGENSRWRPRGISISRQAR